MTAATRANALLDRYHRGFNLAASFSRSCLTLASVPASISVSLTFFAMSGGVAAGTAKAAKACAQGARGKECSEATIACFALRR
jgi:hypothetical protein